MLLLYILLIPKCQKNLPKSNMSKLTNVQKGSINVIRNCKNNKLGPPSWSLDASETGEKKMPVGGGGHLVLSPLLLACIKRPRWRPVELNDRHLRSHGKIGDYFSLF